MQQITSEDNIFKCIFFHSRRRVKSGCDLYSMHIMLTEILFIYRLLIIIYIMTVLFFHAFLFTFFVCYFICMMAWMGLSFDIFWNFLYII